MSEVKEENKLQRTNWVICGKRESGKSHYVYETLQKEVPETACIFVFSDIQETRTQWESFPNSNVPIVVSRVNLNLLKWLTLQTNVSVVLDDVTKRNDTEFWEIVSTLVRFQKTSYPKLTLIVQDLHTISNDSNLSKCCDVLVFTSLPSSKDDQLKSIWNPKEVRFVKSAKQDE